MEVAPGTATRTPEWPLPSPVFFFHSRVWNDTEIPMQKAPDTPNKRNHRFYAARNMVFTPRTAQSTPRIENTSQEVLSADTDFVPLALFMAALAQDDTKRPCSPLKNSSKPCMQHRFQSVLSELDAAQLEKASRQTESVQSTFPARDESVDTCSVEHKTCSADVALQEKDDVKRDDLSLPRLLSTRNTSRRELEFHPHWPNLLEGDLSLHASGMSFRELLVEPRKRSWRSLMTAAGVAPPALELLYLFLHLRLALQHRLSLWARVLKEDGARKRPATPDGKKMKRAQGHGC